MKDTRGNVIIWDTLDTLRSSWWTIVAGILVGLAGSIAALHFVPKVYEASTRIYVAAPKISKELVPTTVTEDFSTRMMAMQEAVLSRPFMERVVDRLFEKPNGSKERERLIQEIKSRADVFFDAKQGTFVIIYDDEKPKRAADVVNTLAQMFIDRNAEVRAGAATETRNTMEKMVDEHFQKLQDRDKEIATFKSAHPYETMEYLETNNQLLRSRRDELAKVNDDIDRARNEAKLVRDQRAAMMGGGDRTPVVDSSIDPDLARVARLQREYEALLTRLTPEHPDVRAKKRELEEAKIAAATNGGRESGTHEGSPISGPLDRQIAAKEQDVARLQRTADRLESDIHTIEARIANTPIVDQRLKELEKGYKVQEETYNRYARNLETAKGSQLIEETQKGSQFEITEPAVVPSLPVKPDPRKFYGAGVALGLLLFVGPVLAGRLLHPAIMSEAGLRDILGDIPVLVTIPRIETPEVVREKKRLKFKNFALSTVSAALLAGVWLLLGQ